MMIMMSAFNSIKKISEKTVSYGKPLHKILSTKDLYTKLADKHKKDLESATNDNQRWYAKEMIKRAGEAAKMPNRADALKHYSGLFVESIQDTDGVDALYEAMHAMYLEFDGVQLDERIIKTDSGYRLVSKKTGQNLGDCGSKKDAEKHEQEVEYFKHQNESVVEEQETTNESLTATQIEKREEIVRALKKKQSGFEDKYGKDAKSVMYATATKLAKLNESEFFLKKDDFDHAMDAKYSAVRVGKSHETFNGLMKKYFEHMGKWHASKNRPIMADAAFADAKALEEVK